MTAQQTFVIVGGGLAGAKAAQTLRDEGFDGRVVLLGEEDVPPYERPPLSKDYLRGEAERASFAVLDEGYYADHDVELRLDCSVERVDASARAVELAGGERLAYDRLLLATGAQPNRLGVRGGDLEGVHLLRTVADSDALREQLVPDRRVVVVGAGWIGCEVAASARELGAQVTVVEPMLVPLERVLGPELGGFYRDVHLEHGVEFVLGTGVTEIDGEGRAQRVKMSDGRELACDLVVAGIGVTPRVGLAKHAGLDVDNGIVVDEHLRSSAPEIFAAGDVANAQHPFYGERVRVEHWANALNQGPVAARAMLGREDAVYDRLPYFFSDQYDVGMEYTGFAHREDRVVIRGDLAGREFIAFWVDLSGRVVAGMNVNVWDVSEPIERIIRSREVIDEARLADPDVALDELVAGTVA
jgi:3-phenylpropionate/trans-cinnamate dioxygenase ferredoxin reductase subunit